MTQSAAELRSTFPGITWDEPVPVKIAGTDIEVWACRYCIAQKGLAAQDIIADKADTFHTREDALAHIDTAHEEE